MTSSSSAAGHSPLATPATPKAPARSSAADELDPAALAPRILVQEAIRKCVREWETEAPARRSLSTALLDDVLTDPTIVAAIVVGIERVGDPPPYLTGGIVRRDQVRVIGER